MCTLHAGKVPASVDLRLYGFGDAGASGNAGKLRDTPKRASIKVTEDGKRKMADGSDVAQCW